jgi:hypothetical protein
MKLGDNPCVIVAHPDDEVLWAGGLILSNPGLKWTVICCSIPRIDTERAWLWNDACDRLGVSDKKLFPALESPPDQYLGALPEVKGYSAYITHGFDGEYGHLHHRQVHHHIKLSADAPVYCFSLNGKHNHELRLAEETYSKKLDALKAYSHIAPYPYLKDVPKWRALLHRYSEMDGLDFRIERFETMEANAAPNAPANAAIDPPPGAGDSLETSSTNPFTLSSTKSSFLYFGKPNTRSSILKSLTSLKPSDCTAISRISRTGIPVDLPCFLR